MSSERVPLPPTAPIIFSELRRIDLKTSLRGALGFFQRTKIIHKPVEACGITKLIAKALIRFSTMAFSNPLKSARACSCSGFTRRVSLGTEP